MKYLICLQLAFRPKLTYVTFYSVENKKKSSVRVRGIYPSTISYFDVSADNFQDSLS